MPEPQTPPKVSIVIPTFNSERYIGETVQSALAQTHGNIEVVVDDNASTDGTLERIAKIAESDKRLRIFPAILDKNIPEGWNRAVSHARGEYFLLLHSDNLLHPRYVESVLGRMEHVGARLAYSDSHYFEGETPNGLFAGALDFPVASHLAPGPRAVAYVFRYQRMVPTSSLLIHRRCLEGRPAYYPRYQFDPDMEQLASLVETYGALHVHVPLAAIRTHGGQAPSWRKAGFSSQYRELLELQHQKGQSERSHFLKQWADSNQDISITLAKNHAPLFYVLKYQLKWMGAELGCLAHQLCESARRVKRWILNFRTWFRSGTKRSNPKKVETSRRELASEPGL